MKKLIAIFALILTLCAPAALFAEEAATPSPDAAAPAAGEKVLRWGRPAKKSFAGAETPRADSLTCSPTRRTRRSS